MTVAQPSVQQIGPGRGETRFNWIGAIAGFVIGYAAVMLVLAFFRWWMGFDMLDTSRMLGATEERGAFWTGMIGGILGFVGGLLGPGLYRRTNFFSAFFWGAVGYALGAAAVILVRQVFGLDPIYSDKPIISFGVVGLFIGYFAGLGGFTYWWDYARGVPTPAEEDHSGHGAHHWTDYFTFNTDHKVIGIQYVVLTIFFAMIGGLLAELMRAELAAPGLQFVESGEVFNGYFSVHAVVMIFLFIIPVFAGLANYVIPLMLGAPDMAFPRLNAMSFWMLLLGGLVFLASFWVGAFSSGWTAYAPLSTSDTVPLGQLLFGLGVQIVGFSSILTAINFIVTIIAMRAPGLSMWRLPLLVWANLTTSLLVVFGTPFIAGAQLMVVLDTVLGTQFFNPSLGGDAVMYQHVFWFYSHPAVYIMMLPGFGIISEIITAHARKPIFGYRALAVSTIAIGFLGFTVWAHHMFVAGMADWLRLPMMITTMLIAVPTGIKVLGWSATLWGGKIHLTTPMLFALGFLFTFTVGGLTGVFLAALPFVISTSDSYFVVAHIHYVLFGGSAFTIFAGIYHWFPKMTGRMYDETLGKWHFWTTFLFMNLTFFPMHWIGTQGMPRRVADYAEEFSATNMFISLAAFGMGISFVIFVYNMVHSWKYGERAPANPWKAHTLEWQVSSPPPLFNFHQTPVVVGPPYEYGSADPTHGVLDPNEREDARRIMERRLKTDERGSDEGKGH